jgi:RNA polymerase sigma-70 factor (ECF subfamily)
MQPQEPDASWTRLIALLAPIHDQVRRTARRLARDSAEGDDLFQETVLRAYRKLSGLRDPERFRGWLYAVLWSVHRRRSRRAFWRRFLSLENEMARGFEPAGEPGTDEIRMNRRAERVSRALATLPAVQREAVVLFELEGFSVEEIAELQKVSVSAVKSRLQRGRGRLRRFYEREGLAVADRGGVGESPPIRTGATLDFARPLAPVVRGSWEAAALPVRLRLSPKEEGHE